VRRVSEASPQIYTNPRRSPTRSSLKDPHRPVLVAWLYLPSGELRTAVSPLRCLCWSGVAARVCRWPDICLGLCPETQKRLRTEAPGVVLTFCTTKLTTGRHHFRFYVVFCYKNWKGKHNMNWELRLIIFQWLQSLFVVICCSKANILSESFRLSCTARLI